MGQEYVEARHAQLRGFMQRHGLAGVVLTRRDNFSWFTGATNYIVLSTDEGFGTLLVTPEARYLVTTNIEAPRLMDEELASLGFTLLEYPWHQGAELAATIHRTAPGRVVADTAVAEDIEQLPGDFNRLQTRLTQEERAAYTQLGLAVRDAVENACRHCERGWTEHQLVAAAAAPLIAAGIRIVVLIAAADDRAKKYRHPIPTSQTVGTGAFLTVVAEHRGLVISCTRQFAFGDDADLDKRHAACAEVQAALMRDAQPGVLFTTIWERIPGYYADAGYAGEWQLHHQGGPTGYHARDFLMDATSPGAVEADQALAWNPTITGAKMEDTYIVRTDGLEFLTPPGPGWPSYTTTVGATKVELPAVLRR